MIQQDANPTAREEPGREGQELAQLVAELRAEGVALEGRRMRARSGNPLPSREALTSLVAILRAVLFPWHFGPSDLTDGGIDHFVGQKLNFALQTLHEQVRRGLQFACGSERADCESCARRATSLTREFALGLPEVRALLDRDIRAAFDGDPAAKSLDEAVFCYPGVTAITHHRLAHRLYELDVPLIPRIISEFSHSATGIDIHPGAKIGGSFFIDHGTGVVIGETCVIGERVRLYQGVTLGAKSFPCDPGGKPLKGVARHPIVENDVVIYAGATILGRVTIGHGTSIGGNVWITRSVPPNSRVTQAQSQSEAFQDGSGI